MAIRIVTDSSSDFDPAVAKRRNVEIVSMPIQFGKATFLDGKTISSEVFYKLLKEGKENHDPTYGNHIGTPIYQLIDDRKLPPLPDFPALGRIILDEQKGRTSDEQILCFINDGMAIFDMGLCHDLYHTALEQGLGQKLLLWESAAQCEE